MIFIYFDKPLYDFKQLNGNLFVNVLISTVDTFALLSFMSEQRFKPRSMSLKPPLTIQEPY
ncbi:hypothetical protein SOPP22_00740 [Shewanella sp. OPT22]|nr:hypothetical protein SOPP22_00740 [Shewanella sp. OPT22]